MAHDEERGCVAHVESFVESTYLSCACGRLAQLLTTFCAIVAQALTFLFILDLVQEFCFQLQAGGGWFIVVLMVMCLLGAVSLVTTLMHCACGLAEFAWVVCEPFRWRPGRPPSRPAELLLEVAEHAAGFPAPAAASATRESEPSSCSCIPHRVVSESREFQHDSCPGLSFNLHPPCYFMLCAEVLVGTTVAMVLTDLRTLNFGFPVFFAAATWFGMLLMLVFLLVRSAVVAYLTFINFWQEQDCRNCWLWYGLVGAPMVVLICTVFLVLEQASVVGWVVNLVFSLFGLIGIPLAMRFYVDGFDQEQLVSRLIRTVDGRVLTREDLFASAKNTCTAFPWTCRCTCPSQCSGCTGDRCCKLVHPCLQIKCEDRASPVTCTVIGCHGSDNESDRCARWWQVFFNICCSTAGVTFVAALVLSIGSLVMLREPQLQPRFTPPAAAFKDWSQQGLSYPPYPICGSQWHSTSAVEFGFLASMAYVPNTTAQAEIDRVLGPHTWSVVTSAPIDAPAYFVHLYSVAKNVSVVSVRGTRGGESAMDWMQNANIWSEAVSLQMMSLVVPLVNIWSIPGIQWFVSIASWAELMFPHSPNHHYHLVIEDYVHEIMAQPGQFGSVMMVGHSLGGGLAKIVAARNQLQALAFGSPGILFEAAKLGIDSTTLNGLVTTVAAAVDVVPKISRQAGGVQHIECRDPSPTPPSCHNMTRILCELAFSCRDVRIPAHVECPSPYN
jgi:hypothetical protein